MRGVRRGREGEGVCRRCAVDRCRQPVLASEQRPVRAACASCVGAARPRSLTTLPTPHPQKRNPTHQPLHLVGAHQPL